MALIPVALYWSVALWGLFSRKPVLIWLFFAVLPLGSMAVVPPSLTGGLSLVPQAMTALLIVVKHLLLRRSGPRAFSDLALRGPGLILLAFWGVGLVVTAFAPRLFSGEITVVPMAHLGFMQSTLLQPTTQNISQLAYISVSVFAIFAFARAFGERGGPQLLIRGLMLAGAVTILTGALDFATTYVPLSPLLSIFRTAEYAILDQVTIAGGAKRVTGLMPEASVFGGLTLTLLSMLWFLRRALVDPAQKRCNFWVTAGLVLMLVLSTSSAGYVGIAVLLMVIGLEWGVRASGGDRTALALRSVGFEFGVALTALGLLVAAIMAVPAAFDPVIDRLDHLVFTKTESLSYLERSFWTRTAFDAGVSSYLIGVGLGSVRASNFAASLFGSTGILGFCLFFGFVAQRLMTQVRSGDPVTRSVASALKWSFFPPFAVSLLIGTTPDFGTIEALRWGVLVAIGGAMTARPGFTSINTTAINRTLTLPPH